MTAPKASAPLTIPVLAALPVVSSTNQGPATKTIMLPTCPTAWAASSERIPVRSATTGCSATGLALRSAARAPRRTRPLTNVRSAPNDSAANGCRDGTSSCPPSTPCSIGDLPMPTAQQT
jgi:hypothetical protein